MHRDIYILKHEDQHWWSLLFEHVTEQALNFAPKQVFIHLTNILLGGYHV